jgi:predicted neuraminidase
MNRFLRGWLTGWILLWATATATQGQEARRRPKPEPAFHRTENLFAPEPWHNHGSCLVELPDGQLLACWFHGSGERKADDVKIEGARGHRSRTLNRWSARFTLADTPGYPDTNPALFLDPQGRLWLLYPTILANLWESALMKVHVSRDFQGPGVPRWERSEVLHVRPGPEFEQTVRRTLPGLEQTAAAATHWTDETRREVNEYLDAMRQHTDDKLYRRLGWMTRAHPQVVGGNRLLVPLYHDGFSFSLMAFSDDQGAHWRTSTPLIGGGNIQPSVVQRNDGHLVAYMRDNGAPPKRLLMAESRDRGETWAEVQDSEIPNPGSGAEVIRLADGSWLYVGNDTEDGRHRLALWLSPDEGRTWPWRRAVESEPVGGGKSFSYPSAIQTRDGRLHVTYSAHSAQGGCIRHVEVNRAWVQAGESGRVQP